MKWKTLAIMLFVLTLYVGQAHALFGLGEASINGVVKNEFGDPIENVQVKIENSRFTTLTNTNGEYVLEYAPGSFTICFVKDGYSQHKMTLNLTSKQEYPANDVILKITEFITGYAKDRARNSIGMTFVYIKPGTFMMGSPSSEKARGSDETLHNVTLTKGFYMQTTEVTQGQWKAIMGSNPSISKNCDDCPVIYVSWDDVQVFIRKLNKKEGSNKYRLPKEAEWEYACRAGNNTAFANGAITETGCGHDPNLDQMGWYCGNSGGNHHPVAQKKSNLWGLYDMHGNIWEWCRDWYGDYPNGNVTDPEGPSSGSERVVRGGTCACDAMICRSAHRVRFWPDCRGSDIGFRLARTP